MELLQIIKIRIDSVYKNLIEVIQIMPFINLLDKGILKL